MIYRHFVDLFFCFRDYGWDDGMFRNVCHLIMEEESWAHIFADETEQIHRVICLLLNHFPLCLIHLHWCFMFMLKSFSLEATYLGLMCLLFLALIWHWFSQEHLTSCLPVWKGSRCAAGKVVPETTSSLQRWFVQLNVDASLSSVFPSRMWTLLSSKESLLLKMWVSCWVLTWTAGVPVSHHPPVKPLFRLSCSLETEESFQMKVKHL